MVCLQQNTITMIVIAPIMNSTKRFVEPKRFTPIRLFSLIISTFSASLKDVDWVPTTTTTDVVAISEAKHPITIHVISSMLDSEVAE